MRPAAIMLQGTGSDVGKSLLTAGLGRAYARRGLKVRPFKPQNMSNNAAVTADGGEIGRAQALQARACYAPPCVHMNPVLLKPETDVRAQVVVHGRVWRSTDALDYLSGRQKLLDKVLYSFARMESEADLVIVEGAGSPAEINLPGLDIANMGFAAAAQVPAVLVGDIDRGGVIASIVGTTEILAEDLRARLKGFIINKFRGDMSLFDSGLDIITQRTGLESFGVVPYFDDAWRLPAEDAVSMQQATTGGTRTIRVVVPVLARIANFDDFDPLMAEPDVSLEMIGPGRAIPGDADLVVLPGSKAVLADLAFLRAEGWDVDIFAHHRRGGAVLGICGGYQMLGRRIADPAGIEGTKGSADGLGLLDVETVLAGDKTLKETTGTEIASGESVAGFEMHVGETTGRDAARAMLRLAGGPDGAVSADGRVAGCYLHGLFAADGFRHAYLNRLKTRPASGLAYGEEIDQVLDALADHLAAHIDLDRLLEVARAR